MTGFFRLRRGALSAEGRFIPMILLILSNFLLKMRIHSLFLPYFNLGVLASLWLNKLHQSFFSDQNDRCSGQRRRSCGSAPERHRFLMLRLLASMAWIKLRTAEYRISNRRMTKGGIALRGVGAAASTSRRLRSIFLYNGQNTFLRSAFGGIFMIRYSIFIGQ